MTTHARARRLEKARAVMGRRRIGGAVARTACFNMAAAGTAALSGVIVARAMGPVARGEYAAVFSWFGLVLTAGGAGQPAAVCFHVARDPLRARGYVATSRMMMLATGALALTAGFVGAPVLAHGNPGLAGAYRMAFAGSVIPLVQASYDSPLQATNMDRWNLVRVSQPACALTGIIMLWRFRLLTLHTAVGVVVVAFSIQLGYAYYWCRRSKLAPGRAQAGLVGPLARYGLAQLAAVTPATVNAYLDQLVLSQLVPPADLGRYAIAASVATVPVPLVSAIGNVAFPRLAARRGISVGSGLRPLVAVAASAVAATVILLPIAVSASWVIPEVFGQAYRGAVPLLWILTPGGIFLACGQVVGDLLRGLGRPGLVAAAQGLAAVFTVILLVALLPSAGVAAAAVASTVAYGIALAAMLRCLWRESTCE